MASWGTLLEETGQTARNLGGRVGHVFSGTANGAWKATSTVGSGIGGFVNWFAKIPIRMLNTMGRMFDNTFGAIILAAGTVLAGVGATIAGAIGIKSWSNTRENNKALYAAQQAETTAGLQQEIDAKRALIAQVSAEAGQANPGDNNFRARVRPPVAAQGQGMPDVRQPNFNG